MSQATNSELPPPLKSGDRFLSIHQVLEKTSFASKTTIYDLERDGNFPKKIPLWGRRVAFLESEVLAWMANRLACRNQPGKENL